MGLVQEAGALVASLSPLQLAGAFAALVVRRSNCNGGGSPADAYADAPSVCV